MPFEINNKINYHRTVYNFSVEDDESYIANGIIVHNTSKMPAQPYMAPAIERGVTIVLKPTLIQMIYDKIQRASREY